MEPIKIAISILAALSAAMFLFAAIRQMLWARAHDKPTELELLRLSGRRSAFEGELMGALLLPFLYVARALPAPNLRVKVQNKLTRAGNPNFYSPDEQLAISCASATMLGVVALALTFLYRGRFNPPEMLATIAMVLVGFYAPILILASEGNRRLRTIAKELPYALDLISLTMGAGSTFVDSVKTYVRGRTGDPLVDELRRLLAEMEFGTPRPAALTNLAARVPIDDVRNIVASVNQAETYGSPLAEVLRAQAGLMRLKRTVAAEKAAAEASVRLLLPMTLILVAVLLLVFAPAVIRWKTEGVF